MSDGDAGHFITSDLVARAFEGARVVIRDVEGTILYWTEGASELYGFGKEESLGKSSHELLQTIFPEPLETINKILLSTGQWSGELQHRSRDGHALIVATHWSLQPYDGKYVVAEVNNDITKETALKRDQAYLATIVASSDDAIMSKSPDGVIQTWNGAAERMFGYTVEEIVGQKAAILFPPHLIDEEAEILARIYTGNSVEIYDTLRRRKDGSTFPVSVRISPIRSEKGEIVGSSKILRDITLQKETERNLEEARDELIQVSRRVSINSMATWIAHEINQPLAAITNYLGALRRTLSMENFSKETVVELAQKATAQAMRVSQIVQRLRDMSSQRTSSRRDESVESIVLEALELLAPVTRNAGVEIRLDIEPRLPEVFVDRIQIQQVIFNLARNACEAMAESPPKELVVRATHSDGYIRVEVCDTGPGLPDSVRAKLFEPFTTTKSEGMGIGLSVCKQIAALHDAILSFREREPTGACFCLALPLVHEAE